LDSEETHFVRAEASDAGVPLVATIKTFVAEREREREESEQVGANKKRGDGKSDAKKS
jgi:hypothetical protein